VKKVIEELNVERDSVDFYEAAPNIGPAGTPSGHVVIAQIYLVDRDSTGWGPPQRQFVEVSNQRVEAWLKSAVAGYNKQVQFSRRSFVIDRDPRLKRLRIGGSARRYLNAEVAAHQAVQFLGYDSIEVFLQKMMTEENANHAVLLYHVNRDDRSFTLPCMKRCRWQTEYAFIYEQARRKRWQSMEYAQAHETLHLFGADDLYRVSGAKRFAAHDIMNYFSRNITDSTIEPITAYAVGLIADEPEVPFRVVNYAN
jgi:hypothetical protein